MSSHQCMVYIFGPRLQCPETLRASQTERDTGTRGVRVREGRLVAAGGQETWRARQVSPKPKGREAAGGQAVMN